MKFEQEVRCIVVSKLMWKLISSLYLHIHFQIHVQTNPIKVLFYVPPRGNFITTLIHTHTHTLTSLQSVERPRVAQPAPVISPPASTPTSSVVPQPSASSAATSTTAPTTAASSATATAQPAKVDLLGDLGGDPFGKKS